MFEHAASAAPRDDARGARPVVTLGRADLERGLRALVSKLEASGVDARIQIVGGAAIALAYNAARRETVDIDAVVSPRDVVIASSAEIAADRGGVPPGSTTLPRSSCPPGDEFTTPTARRVQSALERAEEAPPTRFPDLYSGG